jgi:sugar lactone lactonase YvrE
MRERLPGARELVADVALNAGDHLGEGPSWDAATGELTRVDINAGRVHRWAPATEAHSSVDLGDLTGFALPRRTGGLVAGVRHSVVLVDADGTRHTLAEVEADRAENRFNDARCDSAGRLWAGTLSMVRRPGDAALYRIDPDGAIERILEGLTIANGIGWSPDEQLMYFIDSTTQRIDVMDFDPAAGRVHDRRAFVRIDAADGLPDGLAVDAYGGVWVALFGGGAVRRYAPDGRLDAIAPLPVSNCTCPAFGGADLDELYVTSARHGLSDEQLAAQPLAGAVFRIAAGVRGLAAHPFGG